MKTQLSGVITSIFPVEKYGNFEKRVFWIKQINVQHPCYYSLELWHDDQDLIDKCKVGDAVVCDVEIRGNYYNKNGRSGVINILKCTDISKY